jgi:hypothetical protein
VAGGGVGHVDQFGLVRRGHDDHVGQAGQIGHVERPGVGRPVGADEPGAVDGKAHRQVLERHVVDHLVVGALEEGRIDRAERAHPLRGHARGKVTACCSAMPTSNRRSG